jgi:hypothetical protein
MFFPGAVYALQVPPGWTDPHQWSPTVGGAAANNGLQFITGGGNVTSTTITSAQSAGFQGIFLDPTFTWSMAGLVINGTSNFIIASAMVGSIGFGGNISYNVGGYVATGSGADGLQIYGTTTQGILLQGLALVGSNTNAVLHMGGGQRRVALENCFIYNTNSAAGAYGLITDTALSNNNGEDNYYNHVDIAGAYAAIGIGIADLGQHSNDTNWIDVSTAGGTYSLNGVAGGGHAFYNYYDRSSPTTITVWNQGCRFHFFGGEDFNNNGAGAVAQQVESGAFTTMINRSVTASHAGNTVVANGTLTCRGEAFCAGTWAVAGTVDISDPSLHGNCTLTGAGTILLPLRNNDSTTGRNTSGVTGQLLTNPLIVAQQSANTGQTTTQTITWTPPSATVLFRVSVLLRITVGGTSTVPVLAYTEIGGVAFSQTVPMWKLDSAITTPTYSLGTGTFTGEVTGRTNNAGAAVTLTITPTGSTFFYSVIIEQLTSS